MGQANKIMKILVITQKIDKKDTVLGFFHRWVEELAKRCEFVTVICLYKGEYNFSENVKVLSLGKENGGSKIQYVFKFLVYILREVKNYDSVFVHMNEEYVIFGGIIWRIFGKKILMWRNHPNGSFITNVAVFLANNVMCTSRSSYTAKFKKTKIMPVGIDVDLYENTSIGFVKNSILFFGRLSPIKNVHLFLEALSVLEDEGVDFHADIIGSVGTKGEEKYGEEIKIKGKTLVHKGKVSFISGIRHDETKKLYAKYDLYVNLTPNGSLDKTMFESCASQTPILVFNSALTGKIDDICQLQSLSPKDIANSIKKILFITNEKRTAISKELRDFVKREHSLSSLISMLISELKV